MSTLIAYDELPSGLTRMEVQAEVYYYADNITTQRPVAPFSETGMSPNSKVDNQSVRDMGMSLNGDKAVSHSVLTA